MAQVSARNSSRAYSGDPNPAARALFERVPVHVIRVAGRVAAFMQRRLVVAVPPEEVGRLREHHLVLGDPVVGPVAGDVLHQNTGTADDRVCRSPGVGPAAALRRDHAPWESSFFRAGGVSLKCTLIFAGVWSCSSTCCGGACRPKSLLRSASSLITLSRAAASTSARVHHRVSFLFKGHRRLRAQLGRGRVLLLSQLVAHTFDVAEDLCRGHPTRVAISR